MNAPNPAAANAAKRRQLAAISARLAELRAQYDVLMNAFKFDEARTLHARIETAEKEHRELAAEVPSPPPAASLAPYRVAARRRRR
ncbi:MAG TPA: hypothetical protein VGR70_20125 [Stellaceae bacterium]|nr:hypothetical protein [Stellaceae bacterium]